MTKKKAPVKNDTPDEIEADGMATVTLIENCAIAPDGFTVTKYKKGRQKIPKDHIAMIRLHFPDAISDK